MIQAAGVLYLAPDDRALFLKRGPGSDHPGEWCFPGGQLDAGETALQAAERETVEEIGSLPDGTRTYWVRSIAPAEVAIAPVPGQEENAAEPVDYTTFLQRIDAPFNVKVEGEHVGYAWAPISQPPEPLHPGCRVALDRFAMNELDVARAMQRGELTSPQRFANVYLFKVRVTGTGVSYRPSLKEYVYRRPENYLTDDFLARCAGLPLIVDHPEGDMLDTKEFINRTIGTVFFAFVEGDEVWSIAKVWDVDFAQRMENGLKNSEGETVPMSTSPNVVFIGGGAGTKLQLEDGRTLLVENSPDFVDHLAVCEVGVWDKGGNPAGVVSVEVRGDSAMAEEKVEKNEAEEQARKDAADLGTKLDKFLSHIDSIHAKLDSVTGRMDAFEEDMKKGAVAPEEKKDAAVCEKCGDVHAAETACKDAKKDAGMPEPTAGEASETAADKRKDAEEKEEAARKDSAALLRRLADLERMVARPLSDEDHRKLQAIQARADKVFSAFGENAPRPLQGQTELDYRVQLADMLKAYSPVETTRNLALGRIAIADAAGAFATLENQIYADAEKVAGDPSTLAEGQIRMISKPDGNGHIIREFVCRPSAWMRDFMPEQQFMKHAEVNLGNRT